MRIQQNKTFKCDPNLLARPSPPFPPLEFCQNVELHKKVLQKHLAKGWTPPRFRAMPVFRLLFSEALALISFSILGVQLYGKTHISGMLVMPFHIYWKLQTKQNPYSYPSLSPPPPPDHHL